MLLPTLLFALSFFEPAEALWKSNYEASSIMDRELQTETVYALNLNFGDDSGLRGNITVNDNVDPRMIRAVNDFSFTCSFPEGPITLSKASGANFEWSCSDDTTSCFQEEEEGLVIIPTNVTTLRISDPSGSSISWTFKEDGENSVSCDSGENATMDELGMEEGEEEGDSDELVKTHPRKKVKWTWKRRSKKRNRKKSGKKKLKKIAKKVKKKIKKKIKRISKKKQHFKKKKQHFKKKKQHFKKKKQHFKKKKQHYKKKKHMEQKGDPMITDFSGHTYFVSSPGAYLNVAWEGGKNSIQSCFYNNVNGHHYTRAIGFKCGDTVMIAHLSRETMRNWGANETVKSFNVYYLDANRGFLGDTGDFRDECAIPGQHNHEIKCSCPYSYDQEKLTLAVTPTRTSWNPASTHHAPTLNIAIDVNSDEDHFISGLSQAGSPDNVFYKSGPNTNGAICEENSLRFDDPEFKNNPCGPETWRLKKGDDLFLLGTGRTEDGYYVLPCGTKS